MPGYTKGTWSFYAEPQPNGCPIVGSEGLMIAMLAHSVYEPSQKEEALANARLISAAPDLLIVLKAIISDGVHCDVVPRLHDKAVSAIEKATGDRHDSTT